MQSSLTTILYRGTCVTGPQVLKAFGVVWCPYGLGFQNSTFSWPPSLESLQKRHRDPQIEHFISAC